MTYKKTPTKPAGSTGYKAGGRKRSASRAHAICSDKRTLLKERIRKLQEELETTSTELLLVKMHVDILHSTLATVVETMGLEGVLDPFGEGLTPDKITSRNPKDS